MQTTHLDAPPDAPRDAPDAPSGREATLPLRPEVGAPVDVSAAPDLAGDARYVLGRTLGAGGMGEVKLCRDQRIGREVAVKLLRVGGEVDRGDRGQDTEARARFVREARVQGQLEHPAVVPVYDLGTWPDGEVFFTMKRVRGSTLEAVLRALAAGDPEARARYSRRRLLTAFSTVCLAVDFAHARGVLHRDLKPANIMLGEFGEVHLLDWGVARVTRVNPHGGTSEGTAVDLPQPPVPTVRGTILGTPGYMSPEQTRGETEALDPRTDVYSLGAILFEIVSLHPLHPAGSVHQMFLSTLQGADAGARARYPEADIPPELDAVCVRATATEVSVRYASARELADAVDRYLDGDRDLAQRRAMADALALTAATAADAALATDDEAARASAMRDATRALALDPGHEAAVRTVTRLLMAPPTELPPEARRAYDAVQTESRRAAAKVGVVSYLCWFAFVPFAAWMGVRSWVTVVPPAVLLCASLALAVWMWRTGRTDVREGMLLMVTSTLLIATLSGVAGPFVLVPAIAVMNAIFFTMFAHGRRQKLAVMALGALTLLLPSAFEHMSLVEPAYTFEHDTIVVHPRLLFLPPVATRAFLVATGLAVVLLPTLLVGRLRDKLAAAERGRFLLLWHLRQLVPEEARREIPTRPRG